MSRLELELLLEPEAPRAVIEEPLDVQEELELPARQGVYSQLIAQDREQLREDALPLFAQLHE